MNNQKSIRPAAELHGAIALPGDKSISHRAAMLLAISEGVGGITNFANGNDCAATLSCLADLGVSIVANSTGLTIEGHRHAGLKRPEKPLNCGNSGTTLRLLSGILAGCAFDSELTGDRSLRARPMKRIIDPLRSMGASVDSSSGFAPIRIKGGKSLREFQYELPVDSAQVKSCLLFAGLRANGPVTIIGKPAQFKIASSRDHSERLLEFLGADLSEEFVLKDDGYRQSITIRGGKPLKARSIDVPGDASAAAYFLVAAAGMRGSNVVLTNVGLNPTRTGAMALLSENGVDIRIENRNVIANEPRGDVRISNDGNALTKRKIKISGTDVAPLIDEIPILAILGTFLPGGLEVRDAAELRLKECDRISAVVKNLRRMGSPVREFEDGFEVPPSKLKGAEIDSYGDHRIAMAFSIAGLIAEGRTLIRNSNCVAISYPDFYKDLGKLVRYE